MVKENWKRSLVLWILAAAMTGIFFGSQAVPLSPVSIGVMVISGMLMFVFALFGAHFSDPKIPPACPHCGRRLEEPQEFHVM